MFRFLVMACVMLVAGVVAVRYVDQTSRARATVVAEKPAPAPAPEPSYSRTVVITPGNGGHFALDARVDGRQIPFIVDTGASHISLRESEAARLGIFPAQRDYTVKLSTANGEGRAARTELRIVEIGNIVVRDVTALIVPDDMLSVNLLGMSFLSRIRWTHEKGKLILDQ